MSAIVPTPNYDDDGFSVAEPTTGGLIKGSLLKFKDDAFLINGTDHLPDDVAQFTAISMLTLWTRWENDKPLHKITRAGEIHPQRDELGDLDAAHWPKNKNGERVDPWQDSRNVVLVHDASAATFTFTTASIGGRIAVAELKDAVALRRRVRPGACPIVELTTATMKTRFGERNRPSFKIVGWHEPDAQPAVVVRQPVSPTLRAMRAEPTSGELMSDDIPFAPEWR
jgi:hypothetical protein